MSKSTEDLIRELEAGGVFGNSAQTQATAVPAVGHSTVPARQSSARSSGLVFLILAAVIVAVVGSLPFGSYALYPFSLFVTLLHETGHAIVAAATGGLVHDITLSPDLSGLTRFNGGGEALVAPAGYLGATLAGVGLLLAPLRYARWILGLLAAVPIATLVLFHPASAFTAVWCAAFAVGLGVAAWKLPMRLVGFLQILLGLEAGLNAFRDLATLVLISSTSSHIQTDAVAMSNALFLPPLFWAVSWTVISLALVTLAVIRLVRRDLPLGHA